MRPRYARSRVSQTAGARTHNDGPNGPFRTYDIRGPGSPDSKSRSTARQICRSVPIRVQSMTHLRSRRCFDRCGRVVARVVTGACDPLCGSIPMMNTMSSSLRVNAAAGTPDAGMPFPFEPRHSTGTSEEASSLRSQPEGGRGILETTPPEPTTLRKSPQRVHPMLHQGNLARCRSMRGPRPKESQS